MFSLAENLRKRSTFFTNCQKKFDASFYIVALVLAFHKFLD